jgi:hypothetical protein
MSKLLIIVIPIALVVGIWVLLLNYIPRHGVQVINCSISEISPDFTNEMREACRKARSGRI